MQRSLLVSIVLLAACGGPAEPAANVQVAAQPTATATATAPAAPHWTAPLGVPRGAPLVASADASALLKLVGGARGELEHELALPQGSLSGDLGALGVDTSRPVTFCYAPLDAGEKSLEDYLRRLGPSPGASLVDDVRARFRETPAMLATRVLVPAKDPVRLESTMSALFAKSGWRAVPGGFRRAHLVATISSDGSWVALDVGGDWAKDSSIESLRRVVGGPHDPAPALDGDTLRATWSPVEVARLGFLMGVTVTVEAVSGESLSQDMRTRIVAQGLKEASSVFTLAGPEDKPFFEQVDLRVRATPLEIAVRARPGAGVTTPPDAAWSPTTSVALGGVTAQVGEARAFFDGWGLPPKPMDLAREGGQMALLVALPQLLVAAPVEIPRVSHTAGPLPEVARRFERVGEAWDAKGATLWYGVLPAKTSRADALCSLATAQRRCKAKDRLTLGKVEQKGHGWAKLVRLDRRFVLLLAKDAATLAVTPKARTDGPLHFEASTTALVRALGSTLPLPDHVVGDVSHDGGAILFRVAAP